MSVRKWKDHIGKVDLGAGYAQRRRIYFDDLAPNARDRSAELH